MKRQEVLTSRRSRIYNRRVQHSSSTVPDAVVTREVQRLFEDLARQRPDRRPLVAGECVPPVDILESAEALQVVVDVPGVAPEAVRVAVVHVERVQHAVLRAIGLVEARVDVGKALDELRGKRRVAVVQDVVIVVGEKDRATPSRTPVSAHLIERDFGRFVRIVPLPVATDASRATATLVRGELRIRVPTLPDRRGRVYSVPVERGE